MTLTESQIAELEAAEKGTTPLLPSMRVERADFDNGDTGYEIHCGNEDQSEEMFVAFYTRNHTPALRAKFNAEFWVLAKTLLPALLAERREMKAEIETLRLDRDCRMQTDGTASNAKWSSWYHSGPCSTYCTCSMAKGRKP